MSAYCTVGYVYVCFMYSRVCLMFMSALCTVEIVYVPAPSMFIL